MAVTITGGPAIFLIPGFSDRRYPIGRWQCDVSGAGDASGGSVKVENRFRASTDDPLYLAFSLTHIDVEKRGGTLEDAQVTITGFSTAGIDGTVNALRFAMDVVASVSGNISLPSRLQEEIFLGSPVRGNNADVEVEWATNDNGVSYFLRAQGLVWLYDGMLDLGGPQPVTSSVPTVVAQTSPRGSLQQARAGMMTVGQQMAAAGIPVEIEPGTGFIALGTAPDTGPAQSTAPKAGPSGQLASQGVALTRAQRQAADAAVVQRALQQPTVGGVNRAQALAMARGQNVVMLTQARARAERRDSSSVSQKARSVYSGRTRAQQAAAGAAMAREFSRRPASTMRE